MDRAEQGDVALPQLEHGAVTDGATQHRVADQGPALATRQLSVILENKIKIMRYKNKEKIMYV